MPRLNKPETKRQNAVDQVAATLASNAFAYEGTPLGEQQFKAVNTVLFHFLPDTKEYLSTENPDLRPKLLVGWRVTGDLNELYSLCREIYLLYKQSEDAVERSKFYSDFVRAVYMFDMEYNRFKANDFSEVSPDPDALIPEIYLGPEDTVFDEPANQPLPDLTAGEHQTIPLYRGVRVDGDPIAFLKHIRGALEEACMYTLTALRTHDERLVQAVYYVCRRDRIEPESVLPPPAPDPLRPEERLEALRASNRARVARHRAKRRSEKKLTM